MFILSHFWRSDIYSQFHGAECRGKQAGLQPGSRQKPMTMPFPASNGFLYSFVCDPFLTASELFFYHYIPCCPGVWISSSKDPHD